PSFRAAVSLVPPHTTIRLPVQTAVWNSRACGALAELVGVQVSVEGLYRPPPLPTREGMQASLMKEQPPKTIISVPVHTAVCFMRVCGAPTTEVFTQLSVAGL